MAKNDLIPDNAIHVPEGEAVPEGYVPLGKLLDEKFQKTMQEQRTRLKELGMNVPSATIVGVPADEAKQLAKDLVEAAPEQMARLVAAVTFLALNQSDIVDRVGLAVQDMVVFMNNQMGQLNTRNYALYEKPNRLTNLRMDFKGRSGDLTDDDTVYGYSYVVYGPTSEEELKAGPETWTFALPLPRTTHYHLTHQLIALNPTEPTTFYLTYSLDMQDPSLAPTRALEGTNPAPNKEVEGELRTNVKID